MLIKTASFVKSSVKLSQCPSPQLPEYAFIGRSNVGKSSLINMLCNHAKLAKVSSTPGKTQEINHFIINNNWYLVDLPGYGYARVSRSAREKWGDFIEEYLKGRENLQYVFVLIDSRLEPQLIDIEFINHLGQLSIPFVIVFTKTDKQNAAQTQQNKALFEKTLYETWEELPPMFFTSAEKKTGKEEVLKFIGACNQQYRIEKKQA
ncbi:MAG: ribosome biogenesis GTP-binding protein YihA/YsxC [Bacteroidia bacterium]|nr:ribosome biogenesis GTP-binding protein YihA/YsxC [Bacteroidia bacterium]